MAIDRVSKTRAICHSSERDGLLAILESSGGFHPASPDDSQDWLLPAGLDTSAIAGRIDELESVIGFLREFRPKPGLVEKLGTVPRSIPADRLTALLHDGDLLWSARRAWRLAMLISERSGDLQEAREEESFLSAWADLDILPEELGEHGCGCGSLTIHAGVCPASSREALTALDGSEPLAAVLELVPPNPDGTARFVVCIHSAASEELRQEIARLGFSPVDFGHRKGRVSDLLESERRRIRALEKRITEFETEAAALSDRLPDLEELRDAAGLLLSRLSATEAGLAGDRLFTIQGWVRDRDFDRLAASVSGLGAALLERIEPDEDEEPPSSITQREVFDPYAMLTEMFGSPSPSDPDPTPLMAPFYSLFLGICIGDAGYGAVLAALAGAGILLEKRKGRRNRLFGILFHGGIAAILVGTLFGGWFGMDRASLPSFMTAPAALLDSLVPDGSSYSVSMQFLYTTMALGVVQLLAGVVINFVKRWRNGERATAVLEQTGWVLAAVGLFPWLFNHYLLEGVLYDSTGPMDGILLFCLFAGAVLIFIMGGREARGFGKVGLGMMAAYGIVNLLADALSYSRLFALSLSGGIIATVVNQISRMLPGTDIPGFGLLITIPVLVFGHVFNIAMSVLGGFIHTARLQFVEYFGKFYEGTGVPFSPLQYKSQYVNIIRDNQGPEGGSR